MGIDIEPPLPPKRMAKRDLKKEESKKGFLSFFKKKKSNVNSDFSDIPQADELRKKLGLDTNSSISVKDLHNQLEQEADSFSDDLASQYDKEQSESQEHSPVPENILNPDSQTSKQEELKEDEPSKSVPLDDSEPVHVQEHLDVKSEVEKTPNDRKSMVPDFLMDESDDGKSDAKDESKKASPKSTSFTNDIPEEKQDKESDWAKQDEEVSSNKKTSDFDSEVELDKGVKTNDEFAKEVSIDSGDSKSGDEFTDEIKNNTQEETPKPVVLSAEKVDKETAKKLSSKKKTTKSTDDKKPKDAKDKKESTKKDELLEKQKQLEEKLKETPKVKEKSLKESADDKKEETISKSSSKSHVPDFLVEQTENQVAKDLEQADETLAKKYSDSEFAKEVDVPKSEKNIDSSNLDNTPKTSVNEEAPSLVRFDEKEPKPKNTGLFGKSKKQNKKEDNKQFIKPVNVPKVEDKPKSLVDEASKEEVKLEEKFADEPVDEKKQEDVSKSSNYSESTVPKEEFTQIPKPIVSNEKPEKSLAPKIKSDISSVEADDPYAENEVISKRRASTLQGMIKQGHLDAVLLDDSEHEEVMAENIPSNDAKNTTSNETSKTESYISSFAHDIDQLIDASKQAIYSQDLVLAKEKYNEAKSLYASSELDMDTRELLYQTLKDLYDLIHLKLLEQEAKAQLE